MGLNFVSLVLGLDETALLVFYILAPLKFDLLVVYMYTKFHACVTKTYLLINLCR